MQHYEGREQAQRRGAHLRQHAHGKRSPLPAHAQSRLDSFLKDFDVLLKFAGKELAHLGVDPLHIGDQQQQAAQATDGGVNRGNHGLLLEGASSPREINPAGSRNCLRSRSSRRAMRPLSRS